MGLNRKDYALVGYPLTHEFRERFEETVSGQPEQLVLSELRRQPFLKMLKTIRTLRADRLFLPLEDRNSRAILPILQGIAGVSDARTIEIVKPNLERKRVSRTQAGMSLFGLAKACLSLRVARLQCNKEISRLVREPRITVTPAGEKNVLYINSNLWFGIKAGGSVGHIAGVANGLSRKGYHVTYASVAEPVMFDSEITALLLDPPTTFGMPYELNHYRFHQMIRNQLADHHGFMNASWIYQRMAIANYSGVVLSRERKIPLVMEYNGSEAWVAKNWGRPLRYHDMAVQAEEICLKHAHVIVTISEVLKDELLERGVEEERIVVYPNCIDPSVFDPERFSETEKKELRQKYGIPEDAVVATFIGTFGVWHGVDFLAEVIRKMVAEDEDWLRQHRVHFLLIGDGLKMQQVRDTLSTPQCQPCYTLTGLIPQADAPAHLAASDILLSPHVPNKDGSRFFGSPTKLFEYMAMGKGIVASDLEQIGKILSSGLKSQKMAQDSNQSGEPVAVLFPPGNHEACIKGIKQFAENRQLREQLGKNARELATTKYTWGHHVAQILKSIP